MYDNLPESDGKLSCKKETPETKSKKDVFHDTPLRYLGYSDDIGAAIRVVCNKSNNILVKNLPKISYIPAGAYITADVISTYNKSKEEDGKKTAAKKAFGEAVFQGLTNILFPILIVGASQKLLGKGFDKFVPKLKQEISNNGEKIANRSRDAALAFGGLSTLLAVSKPVDDFSNEVLMKKVINPVLGIKDEEYNKISQKLGTTQG